MFSSGRRDSTGVEDGVGNSGGGQGGSVSGRRNLSP